MVDLSIIIVSYNTEELLRKCLQSVYGDLNSSKISPGFEIIVVDNASKDKSVEMVKKEFQGVEVIENKENLGFSKANNIGVKKSKGNYVLFLNSDTVINVFSRSVLATMIEFMDFHTDAGAATCKVQLVNGKIDDATHRGFPTPWNAFFHFSGIAKLFPHSVLFNGYNLGWKQLDRVHEIDSLAGAFMIVRRIAGDQVRWWDEDYFFYGEDIDFCYRLKQKGWKIYFVPMVSILHYKGVSGGIKSISKDMTTADSQTRKKVTDARFDAMRIFYKKHYKDTYPPFLTWIVMQGINLKQKLS